ncbi:hypothetical protein FDP41_008376 [Naegleria fowleri]|uniref:Uncharacterized protein n=1 Tax=Naegleria fowleri TaxID=5763 RepID=A0A6A5BJC8_NAEFO|nr:uncharacterized protein FDP41_008376 [Naegleria fowleri]KAF0973169.1 hypothetical protein FDP41_008376 [Naegleria fowleri]CAG4714461.1 unnamed protein product [Naegleria fowleri]
MSREQCAITDGDPLSKMVVLHTNLHQLIQLNDIPMKDLLKNQNPFRMVFEWYKQFKQQVNREPFYTARVSACSSNGPKLSFSMQEYIETLFKGPSGKDMFADLPEVMGNSFGKFNVDKLNPSAIFTLNIFNDFVYSKSPPHVRDQATIIPSLFHVARQAVTTNNVNDIKMEPMICSDSGLQRSSPSSVVSIGENAGPQTQPPKLSEIRQERREMNNVVKEKEKSGEKLLKTRIRIPSLLQLSLKTTFNI